MSEVVCWYCENYRIFIDKGNMDLGICLLNKKELSIDNKVCEHFIIRSGLYTKRDIPDCCVNYKKNDK